MALTPEELQVLQRIEHQLKDMPFYVVEYIRSKKRAGLSADTLLQYLYRYQHFFKWLLREGLTEATDTDFIPYSVLAELKKHDVELYIEFLKEESITHENNTVKKRGNAVVTLSVNALKSLFNYLTKETENEDSESYFYRNVMSKIVLHTKKETASRRAQKISSVILNEHEIHDFLQFIEQEYETTLTSGLARQRFNRDKERDLAILSLFLGSGIRLGEMARILVKKVFLKKQLIDIKRKGSKEDTVRVMDQAIHHLKDYIEIREARYLGSKEVPFLFVTLYGGTTRPLSRRAIENLVTKYTAAFAQGEGLSPHKLRHSFAADFIRNGGNIVLLRDQLGHSNIETTSLYTNLSNKDNQQVLTRMENNRLKPSEKRK
ncbi:site-specific tyrosine recombinase XerS [Planococcus antarcticus DSM 14505]|uniref:Site-specific tyrosine recombinase XerS n=1 Tax=Planococcus antarcticus DSM 14505 TaxID=1185653 RepID=A0AA87IPD9_9BACL|nr:tyrosine recombinase XerS [Planococcus antarcticus]EIM08334.1 site-specific tyrosine recombinase XerS [Planococcus antarcticus DSM 14505]